MLFTPPTLRRMPMPLLNAGFAQDHILILSALHLRSVLLEYIDGYYNIVRPHQGIGQRFPIPNKSLEATGSIQRRKMLGGIINDYYRVSGDLVLSS